MNRQEERAIANDLNLCDLVLAVGGKKAKRKAKAHRRACFAQIQSWNKGAPSMTDAEILAALGVDP
jgi:hypothetical protein